MATFIELFILFMVVKYFLLALYRKPKVAKYSLFMEGYPFYLFLCTVNVNIYYLHPFFVHRFVVTKLVSLQKILVTKIFRFSKEVQKALKIYLA